MGHERRVGATNSQVKALNHSDRKDKDKVPLADSNARQNRASKDNNIRSFYQPVLSEENETNLMHRRQSQDYKRNLDRASYSDHNGI